jgi:hypothetical protein
MTKRGRQEADDGEDYAERQARWSATMMTEETKQWVRETMRRAVARTGMVTETNVAGLVKNSTVTDRFRGDGLASASDVVWAWIAEEQAAESGRVAADLQRRSRARNRRTLPRWRWYAKVRSGWERPAEMGRSQVVTMQEADRLLSMMWWKQEHRDWDSVDDSEVLRLRRGTVRRVWSVVKRCGYQGTGGYGRYLQVLAVLMLWGEVEGSVGGSPKEDWWTRGQQQAELMGVQTVQETLGEELDWDVGSEGPELTETVMDVVVDWMACTQSLKAAVPEGVAYLPYDKQEWVFSSKYGRWVHNLPVDLLGLNGQELWARVQADMQARYGAKVRIGKVFLAMSPCCRTFSKVDSSNTTRGHNYRKCDKDHPTRPPRDDTSVKGRRAHRADRMVRHGIKVARYFEKTLQALFYLENPVGNLCRRPYMRGWEADGVRRVEVHYCAYRHFYHKPTHLWTNMTEDMWSPRGSTGTGRCEGRCSRGSLSAAGRWTHTYKIAQGSRQAKGGRGRKANKNMMPQELHEEVLLGAGIRI